tara:strand:- start:344 stop:556 length:213 start_codon:yes stop_codon:yes gene_type:complete
MIYKFKKGEQILEVFQGNTLGYSTKKDTINLIIEDVYGNGTRTHNIVLEKEMLYDLIGALHSIQTKIKNI